MYLMMAYALWNWIFYLSRFASLSLSLSIFYSWNVYDHAVFFMQIDFQEKTPHIYIILSIDIYLYINCNQIH